MATILHISPDERTQKLVQQLVGHQYNLISATDSSTAIQYCAMIQPDLILMDFGLPNLDGDELATRLKMFMPQTPILNFVNSESSGHSRLISARSEDNFLVKPVDPTQLQVKIRQLLPEPIKLPEFAASSQLLDEQATNQFEAQIISMNQANKRLASLNTVSALIGTSLDLDHLTDQILGQIQKTIEFDSATLFLLKGKFLEAAASRGLSEHQRGMNIYTKSERNSAWRVVKNKLPLIINNVLESEYWEPRPELSQVRSWLGVPLIYKDRVVGVLTLDKNEVNGFHDSDARYVFTLAYQIAITVENAQLFEEWESQATRLKLINEVAQEITTILDVDHLYRALAQALFERLNYDRIAILEVDSSRTALTLKAYHGDFLPKFQVNLYRQSIDIGLIGQVVETGMPVLINDFSTEPNAKPLAGKEVKSELIIPIFVDTQVEAVINIDSNNVDEFSDQDLWTLCSLASQASTVIENARLYQDVDAYSNKLERLVEARTQRLQAIRKISQVVSQGLEIDELIEVVGQGIGQIFTPQGSNNSIKVTIGLVNGAKLSVKTIHDPVFVNGNSEELWFETNFKINYQTLAGQVIKESKPIIVTNFNPQRMFKEISSAGSDFVNSIMVVPLVTAGKTIGLIMVERQKPAGFDESDLEILETLAFQVATGVEHARLLRKTRELAIVDERTRLARDMHDGVAQNLAYLLIQVDRCLNMVDEESKLGKQLDQISVLLTQNIEEIRRNIFDLRPVELEGKSLFEVLKKFVAEFGRRWNLKTSCSIKGRVKEVPAEVESSLYRILQETLSNARQHAQCGKVYVKLAVNNEGITLEVADDGQGFEVSQTRQSRRKGKMGKGLGLISIRERAENVGGQLRVESIPGEGTTIFAWLPLQAEVMN